MRKVLREIIALILRYSGIIFFMREIFFRNKVTIVYYHDPQPEIFEKHVKYFAERYNFISLDNLIDAIVNKNSSSLPCKSMLITFDDGYKGNYALLGIFIKYKIRPTIYLCSHIINTYRRFWFDASLLDPNEMKGINNAERLRILEKEAGFNTSKEYLQRVSLNTKELSEMLPYVDFQSHTKFHPILTTCADQEAFEEIREAKEYLLRLLNCEINHFSYPDGDYSDREITYVKKCGYKSARTCDIGWNSIMTDPYRLKAMGLQDNASLNVACCQASGIFGYCRYFKKGSLFGKRPKIT